MPAPRLVLCALSAAVVAGRPAAENRLEVPGGGPKALKPDSTSGIDQLGQKQLHHLHKLDKLHKLDTHKDDPSVANKTTCKSIRPGAANSWCDRNCINTPDSFFCKSSCHCPGWNVEKDMAVPRRAKDTVCVSTSRTTTTDSWCNDNCAESTARRLFAAGKGPHSKDCHKSCDCSVKLKKSKDEPESDASPSPTPSMCTSVNEETAPAEWCDLNCQEDPNANWCADCRCPGFSQKLVDQKCTSVNPSTPAHWCQETCADTPDTKACAMSCHCPGWEAAHVQPLHAPEPVKNDDKAPVAIPAAVPDDREPVTDERNPLVNGQPVPAEAPKPVKPATFEKVCKRKIGSSVSADWCDKTCATTPESDECSAVCDCPTPGSLAKKHVATKAVKTKCQAKNDLGLGDKLEAAKWCDLNCLQDATALWCQPCMCPGPVS